MRPHVLIVEDEPKTAVLIADSLREEGWTPETVADGNAALELLRTTSFDAVVLDVMLPGTDGLSIVRELRAALNRTPILMLSARGGVEERIEGLNAGADDYLAKPFDMGEVVARLHALTRRSGETAEPKLAVGDLTLDLIKREARRAGQRIDLSPREFRLLEVLMRQSGRICSRSYLLREVWDYKFDPGTNLVDVYVRRLRDRITLDGSAPLLHTMRGVGYLMKSEP